MKNLPLGIQDFKKLREGEYLYVDKTQHIYNLLTSGSYYFLTRPRRFGKSLLLSTIKEIYQGNKALFKDLWIEDKWDWTKKNPVIHIGFNSIGHKNLGLEQALHQTIDNIATQYGITLTATTSDLKFKELIKELFKKYGQVVILIDEYDKPIIDYLGKEEIHIAKKNQETLKTFYSPLKFLDGCIKLLLLTGVSKFSKTGIFSELNNLTDLTLKARYASLLGYTQEEVDRYFEPYKDFACQQNDLTREELDDEVKKWYNGYSWKLGTYVYNPYSLMSFYEEGDFSNYWFASGTPTFLIKLLKERFYYDFDGVTVGKSAFESHDIEHIETNSLLFQTGYLTLKEKKRNIFRLGYPNQEVKESMLQHLMGAFRHGESGKSSAIAYDVEEAFIIGDLAQVMELINGIFATIPYQLFENQQEKYYHSLVHILFTYLGIYIESEVNTSKGRADAIVQTDDFAYFIEFKLDKSADTALQQIQEKGYANKYLNSDKKIQAVGINFSSTEKRIVEWKVQELQ